MIEVGSVSEEVGFDGVKQLGKKKLRRVAFLEGFVALVFRWQRLAGVLVCFGHSL